MPSTHWGRVTHICVSTNINIDSDNGLSPGRRQAIIWTNAGILLIGLLGTNFSEILIKIYTFSFKKMHLKMSFGKWRPSCLGLNVLTQWWVNQFLLVKEINIDSDNDLLPVRRHAITRNDVDLSLVRFCGIFLWMIQLELLKMLSS